MDRVRAFDIAQEGFRLVRREPKAVFMWGLLISLVQVIAPLAFMAWLMFSQDGIFQLAMSGDSAAESTAMQALEWKLNLMQLFLFPLTLLVTVVAMGAVYRAVLDQEDRARFYMRTSKAEGWLLLVGLVACVLIGVPLVIALLVIAGVTFATAMASKVAAVVIGILFCAAAFVAYAWIGARFSMASPMTFKARDFRLFESWTLTRGHTWLIVRVWIATLLLVLAAAVAVSIGAIVVFVIPMVVIAVPLAASAQDVAPEVWFAQHLGLVIGLGGFFGLLYLACSAFLSGAYVAVLGAPFARLFQLLTAEPVEATPEQPAPPIEPEPLASAPDAAEPQA